MGRDADSVGRLLIRHVRDGGYTGQVHAVGRVAHELPDGQQVHARVADIDAPIDLAIVAVPAPAVVDAIRDCARAGVKGAVVVSAGFAETGDAGARLQDELLSTARRLGMRIVGPNSLGLLNARPQTRLNASFVPTMPDAGGLGLFTQSGALGIAILESAQRRGLGVGDVVSAGNRCDVSGNDVMQHWIDDESTTTVGLYLESVGNPRKFSRIARRLSMRKPVLVVKSGVTSYGVPRGHRVRRSQVSPAAFDSLLAQAGVIRVENTHQMFDIAQLVQHQPLPAGRRVGIVGNSDALGALAADVALSWGLEVAHGPVNLPPGVSPDDFGTAVRAALADDAVDAVITGYMPPQVPEGAHAFATALTQAAAGATKPVLTTFLGMRGLADALRVPGADGEPDTIVPSYALPEDGVRALAATVRYGEWRARDKGALVMPEGIDHQRAEALVEGVLTADPAGRDLTPAEVHELLAAYGIDLWPVQRVATADEAVAAADRIGYPVVVKTVSPIVSAQPISGVRAGLARPEAVREAFQALDGYLAPLGANTLVVQRMAPLGTPCIVAKAEDPLFGPVLAFSLAGAPTEVMEDIAYRIPPLTDVDVDDLVRSVKAAPLLFGHAGTAPVDVAALHDVIARVSIMADQLPEVVGLRLNPVNTHAGGAEVLGASARVAPAGLRTDSARRSLTNR